MMRKFLPRLHSAIKYLSWSDKPWKWKLIKATCPSCRKKIFISLGKTAFQLRCISCGANGTNLSLIPVIEEHKSKIEVASVWEMSTYGATLNYLNKNFNSVVATEFNENHNSGEFVDGILNQDVQKTSFANDSFDIITSNQVFEHVPDNVAAFAECYRVLKPGGALIFSVPLYKMPRTVRLAQIKDGKLELLVEPPEYHASRATGAESVLTFWRHSINDIQEIVTQAGFLTEIREVCISQYSFHKSAVLYAIKQY